MFTKSGAIKTGKNFFFTISDLESFKMQQLQNLISLKQLNMTGKMFDLDSPVNLLQYHTDSCQK